MVELNYRPLSALALSARASKLPASANVHLWELPKRRMLTLRMLPFQITHTSRFRTQTT